MGNNARAATLFREALECFSRLSDPEMRRVDEAQTGSYLAIALMDDNQVSPEDARDAVEVVTGDLSTAVARLAGSSDPGDRYKHHLLLRWLVHRGDDDTREAYMAQQNEWSTGAGHPWPLIQLYRGMLIRESDPNKALELALDGASRAFSASQGPTVELIGTCCRLVAVGWGVPWPEADTVLDELEKELPMASDRIAELRTAMTARQEPLGLMASVLPFNFR